MPDASTPSERTRPEGATSARSDTRLGYLPGLDGLRAISVLAVLLFHFQPGHGFLPGGFLGVEVFFVISGYLITSLLLREQRTNRRVSLRDFWLRRARRLLAALYATLVTVALVVGVFFHDELGALRGPLFSGATYWSNIQQILARQVYAQEGVRVPLQHLWSLAVEEQFYVAWPLVFVLGMFLLGRKRLPWLIGACAVTSSAWMAYLSFSHPHPGTNEFALHLNRIYLGTDTRVAGILWGALLACFWSPRRLRGEAAPQAGRLLDRVGLVAGAIIALLMFFAHYDSSVWLYSFGFQLVDLCTVVLIACTVHPLSRLGRWFGVGPLRAIGLRSYGIYLWGIVIFEFTRPGFDLDWPTWAILVLRVVLVGVVAEASYRFLEVPVRNGALGAAWRRLQESTGREHDVLVRRWQVVCSVSAIVVVLISVAAAAAPAPHTAEITDGRTEAGAGDDVLTGGTVATLAPTTTTVATGPTTTVKPGTPTTKPVVRPSVSPGETGGYAVTAVGDSVLLGAADTLARTLTPVMGGVLVNAEVGRQASVCVDVLRALRDQHVLAPTVIVHCGDNGTISSHFVDDVMAILGSQRHVMFVTLKVPRSWEAPNNDKIMTGAAKYRNARVFDWHWFGVRIDPKTYFYKDQFHLTPAGRTYYSDLVLSTLQKWHWA